MCPAQSLSLGSEGISLMTWSLEPHANGASKENARSVLRRGGAVLGLIEDVVSAYSAPDDVWFPLDLLFPVLEGRPTVIRPGHFKDPLRAPDTFDAQSFSEWPLRAEVFNELLYGELEAPLVLGRECCVISSETVGPPVGGQSSRLRIRLEGLEEIVV